MLETADNQANRRGDAQEDDGDGDHHGHLDVHLHHAVDVPERTAGLTTADRVVRRILGPGTFEIFLEQKIIGSVSIDVDDVVFGGMTTVGSRYINKFLSDDYL